MMPSWLVVWGGVIEQIRYARGNNEQEACKYAFGLYAENMTAYRISAADFKVYKRRRVHVKELLKVHMRRFLDDQKLYEYSNGASVVNAIEKYLRDNP